MPSQSLHRTLGLAMGTLNTCLLMVVIVLSLHATDKLSSFLGSLHTVAGLVIFALLWTTTTYCTYRGWAETAPEGIDDRIGARFLEASARWGFASGFAFFLIALFLFLLASSLLALAGREESTVLLATWIFGLLAGVFGTPVAGTVGVLFGMVFAAVDVLLAKLVLAILRPIPAP